MSLKTGDKERRARIEYLSIQIDQCDKAIDLISERPHLFTNPEAMLDEEYNARTLCLSEYDTLCLKTGYGDLLDEDYSDYFRDDLDIDKIAVKGGGLI